MTDLRHRAKRVLAGGPATFSKAWSRYPQGLAPFALVAGEGAYVTGDNGKTYLDTVGALGAKILGYGHPVVIQAVFDQLLLGDSFSMLHPLEVEVAEQLVRFLPCAERVRFFRNGSDATNSAVRLTRAITGKQHVLYAGYHGGNMDSYGITTDKPAGILPQLAPYNHQISWGRPPHLPPSVVADLAAVMVEVPPVPWGQDSTFLPDALQFYRGFAHDSHALFILDEVVTFPRYALGGAQTLYGITPDLCCVSKALANGLPLAALAGQAQYMDRLDCGDVFASSTFGGETTGLAAAKATLIVLETTDALTTLWDAGQRYGEGLAALFAQYALPATVWGTPARLQVRWQDAPDLATTEELRTFWLAEHARQGVLHGIGVIFPQTCWGETEVTFLLKTAEEVCEAMSIALHRSTGSFREQLPCPVITDVLSVR